MTPTRPSHRAGPGPRLLLAATTALAAGVLLASAAERLAAAPSPPPSPLGRDEEFVVRFAGPAPLRRAVDGGLTVTTASGAEWARGVFVAGRAFIDPANGRAVVVRPEALREYFVLVERLTREEADAKAERLLARVERTGDLAPLTTIDLALRALLGDGAGARLDDPAVTAFFPAQVGDQTPLAELRRMVAGDDALWRDYLVGGQVNAFSELDQDPRFERFFHPVDAATGQRSESSVLRQRQHRRVLMRRTRNVLTFLPDIPMRADLADAGFAAGGAYTVRAARSLRPSPTTLFPDRGGLLRFARGLATFDVAPDAGDGGVFVGGTARTSVPHPAEAPRVVNMTPPAGESFIDPTTDWEDPDNQFSVPIPARRLFTIRLRFSRPLDPRTVDATHFTLTKVGAPGTPPSVSVPVAVGAFLAQRRMGEVVVEVTPVTNLAPGSHFQLRVDGTVTALDGTPLGTPFVAEF